MTQQQAKRLGEIAAEHPQASDASLQSIGRIHTPWERREDCPRQGDLDGPTCQIEVFQPWDLALAGLEPRCSLEVLYWLHHSRRDLVL